MTYGLRISLIIFVVAIALSPLFTNLAELESLGLTLTPEGYMPIVRGKGETPTPTSTPLPTPTSTLPPVADVRISFIDYNPPGDDWLKEVIWVTNFGGAAQDIEGWSIVPTTLLKSGDGEVPLHDPYYFLPEILDPGETVRVWTRIGIDNPPYYFWNASTEIWLNGGDTATLRDDQLNVVDVCVYTGGGQNTTCD